MIAACAIRLTGRHLRYLGQTLPCVIGRSGTTLRKREGDGATPAGCLRITACLYRPDRMAPPCPWARPIALHDIWSDDPADPGYNRRARAPSRFGHERLRRPDPLYDLILTTDWNRSPARPSHGSAIFLHRWRAPTHPTAGCIALARRNLLWLARAAPPGTRLLTTT